MNKRNWFSSNSDFNLLLLVLYIFIDSASDLFDCVGGGCCCLFYFKEQLPNCVCRVVFFISYATLPPYWITLRVCVKQILQLSAAAFS